MVPLFFSIVFIAVGIATCSSGEESNEGRGRNEAGNKNENMPLIELEGGGNDE
jgi:hypothetical protein